MHLSQDFCMANRALLGNFVVSLGYFKNSNENLTMKKPRTGKNEDNNFFCPDGLQDSKTVFKYEIRPK